MSEESQVIAEKIKTVRAYYKLCQKQEHRLVVLKDKVFFSTLPTLLKDECFDVIRYTVKILVLLTEQADNIELLLKSDQLLGALTEACENVTNPSVNYNLMLVSSRLRAVKESIEAKKRDSLEPLANAVKEMDKGGAVHRKFVGRKSKQITMEFDPEEFNETKKHEVERMLLKKKGVISVYITSDSTPKAVLRTVPTLDVHEISDVIFRAGFEYVAQCIKVDGKDEKFELYASEWTPKNAQTVDYPEYLDDDVDLKVDPASCVITNDQARGAAAGNGWFSSITSFLW